MIECIRFKSFPKGHLQGFADFYVPKWGVEIQGCSLYMKDGRRWVNLPSKEYQNDQGEKKFAPFLRFKEEAHWKSFVEAMKVAIDKYIAENPQEQAAPERAPSFGAPDSNQDDGGLPF